MTRLSNFKNTVAPLALGLALISAPSFAQDAEDGAEDSDKPIVVTGSLVKRPNEDSAAPVTVVGGDDFKGQGATKVEDLFNSLPQVIATQSSGVSNGADGTATVDLRGLGVSRTLVLVDGKRLMPGGIGGGAGADLNFIPSALISSVEILTGGASSTYGADAVSGVVNFKMNREFQGVRLDGQYSMYQHNNNNEVRSIVNTRFSAPEGSTINGGAYDVSLAIGSSLADDRGNIVAYAGLRHETAITQDKYDYSICTLNPSGGENGDVTDFFCGGSGTPAVTRIGGISAANAALAGLPTAGSYTITATGARPFVASDQFNFAPANYFRRPSTRYTAGVFADYEISSAFNPYLDVMFMDYSTEAQIAPSGAFFGPRTVNCNNPFLTTGNPTVGRAICGAALGTATNATALIGKRNVEGGDRFNDIGFSQFRVTTGMKGDISENWSYDVSAQFGQISVANTYRNDVSSARIDDALLVGGTLANPVCLSGNPSCVPYNVFQTGGVTAAAANYIGIPLVITGKTKETIVNGTVFGDLGFASPFAEDTVGVAFGGEWRKEQLETQPDLSYINGDGAGQGGPTLPIDGQYSVRDAFAEVVVPLVQGKTFFEDLSLELGFRNSSYKVRGGPSNSENTYKIAANWSPVDMLKIRGSINRAVRSPNIGELFISPQIGLFAGSDPCAGAAVGGLVNGNTAAQCARTGVTAAQFGNIIDNSAQQFNQLNSGFINLTPEKADSWTAGFVLTPNRNISLSVDYYNIKVKNAIGTIGSQLILDQCIATNDPLFCGRINRSTTAGAEGSLWLDEVGFVDNQTTNTGSSTAKGVDVNFEAKFPIGENSLTASVVGTYVQALAFQPLTGGSSYNCSGLYGLTCGNPSPKWKHAAKLRFATANDFAATLTWRYVGDVKADYMSKDCDLNGLPCTTPPTVPTPTGFIDEKIKAENYFDLLFSVPLKDTVGFRLGINNILDNDPPLVSQANLGGFGNGNVFPGTYDHLGRYLFVGVTADF